jgi:GT2 family glycosyltransferase
MLIRRPIVEEIGEFDETFAPAWFEDVDYCRRMAQAKATIELVPGAVATHHGGSSLVHMPEGEFVDVWYKNLFRYASKWMRSEQVEVLRWAIIAGMLLRAGAVMIGLRGDGRGGRLSTARSYLAVAGKAFRRWDAESRSS